MGGVDIAGNVNRFVSQVSTLEDSPDVSVVRKYLLSGILDTWALSAKGCFFGVRFSIADLAGG